jgi:hypothetical protein
MKMKFILLIVMFGAINPSPLLPDRDPEDYRGTLDEMPLLMGRTLASNRPSTDRIKMEPSHYRLPGTTIPERYDIKLIVDPTKTHFTGETTIWMKAKEDNLDEIILHAYKMTFSSITLRDEEGNYLQTTNEEVSDDRNFLILTLTNNRTLVKDETYRLDFYYTAKYPDYLHGLYKSSYIDSNGDRRYIRSNIASILQTFEFVGI